MEKITIIHDGDKKYFAIPVPENYACGFISKSGKSFVYRLNIGGVYTTYLHKKLPEQAILASDHLHKIKAIEHEGKLIWKHRQPIR